MPAGFQRRMLRRRAAPSGTPWQAWGQRLASSRHGVRPRCRLLYLVGELHQGGLERQLYYLVRALHRDGYDPAVAVWNYCETDFHVREISALGVPMYPVAGTSRL